jgi:hypothetical protein
MGRRERSRAVEHLANCETCLDELVEVGVLTGAAPRRRGWLVPAAVAAVLALLVLGRMMEDRPDTAVLRDSDRVRSEALQEIVVNGPADGVHPDSVRFTWRSVAPAATYEVTVTDDAGDVVWAGSSADTAAAVPPQAGLLAHARYYWFVDALLADGQTATSGVQEFQTGP